MNAKNKPTRTTGTKAGLSTGKKIPVKLPPATNGRPHVRIQEIMVEPGCLFVPGFSEDGEAITHHFRPTLYNDLLDAIIGYQKFITSIKMMEALRQYVVVFAHGNLYGDSPRHAMLIRKPLDSSLHGGLLNLPGGRIEPFEHSEEAALREFYEETGWQAHMPQLMGVLLPSMYDMKPGLGPLSPYIVYCYRAIIRTIDKQTAVDEAHQLNIEKHDPMWYPINELGTQAVVPSLPCLMAHMATETRCFIIQDCWRDADFNPTLDPNFNAQVQPRLRCQSQEIVTYYTPDPTLEARLCEMRGVKKKRRINDA